MKWEYKVVYIKTQRWTSTGLPENLGEQFDQWGDEGRDLEKVVPILGSRSILGGGTRALVVFFKRPKE